MSYSKILENFYLGNQYSTKILTDVDIIISTGANSKQTTGQILNKRYPIKDKLSFDITPYLDEVCDLIHKYLSKGKKVLIHCK